jgi:uncharacterized protein
LSHYLDTSVLVPLLREEPFTPAVIAWLAAGPDDLVVSTYANGEVFSAFSRLVRSNEVSVDHAITRLGFFDEWLGSSARAIDTETPDIAAGVQIVRRFEFGLRLPDAIHVAAARARGMTLVTLDRPMAKAARELGVQVVEPA